MKKYRYLTIETTDFFNLADQLNELGQKGYRVVQYQILQPDELSIPRVATHFVILEAEVVESE